MQTDSILADLMSSVEAQIQIAIASTWKIAYAQGQYDANAKIRALLQLDESVGTVRSQEIESQTIGAPMDGPHVNIEVPTPVTVASSERKRAPKGLPLKFVERVLRDRPGGVSLDDIMSMAQTDHEKMIAASTIRGELRSGHEKGRYEKHNDLWTLVDNEVLKNEAED